MDIMARTRAISLDIKSVALHGKDSDKFNFDFIKNIDINFEDLENLDNQDIINFDKEYKVSDFSYCLKVKHSDQVILASIQNNKIKLLDEEEVRNQIITPLNKEQLFFSNAIINHFYNVLIVEAKAGSGKTLLALSGALKLVKQKHFQKIIYIRNSIESLDKGEDVGYLPGLEEKFRIYNHPLMDSLEYIIRTEHKRRRSKRDDISYTPLEDSEVISRVEQMISNYGIETIVNELLIDAPVVKDGKVTMGYHRLNLKDAQIIASESTFAPLGEETIPSVYPKEMETPDSAFPGMLVYKIKDSGASKKNI